MDIVELKDIGKVYRSGEVETVALDSINLRVSKGEFIAIMGPSGSGKSTLMHIIGLLDQPTGGRYKLNGNDVSRLSKGRQAAIRNHEIGFVFQQFNLLPRATVLENVLLPTIYGKIKNPTQRATELINQVGLMDRIKNRSNQLSGGQIQRVAIARALVMNPTIILADEPTGQLDTKHSAEIMQLLRHINQTGSTIILITHEAEVASYADRAIYLRDGQIVDDSEVEATKKAE